MGTSARGLSPYEEWKLRRDVCIYNAFRLMGGVLFVGAVVIIALLVIPFAGSRPKRRIIGKGSQRPTTPGLLEYTDWDDTERGRNGSLAHPA